MNVTVGATLLLHAHYVRQYGARAEGRLRELMALLRDRRLAISFEMVTGAAGRGAGREGCEAGKDRQNPKP